MLIAHGRHALLLIGLLIAASVGALGWIDLHTRFNSCLVEIALVSDQLAAAQANADATELVLQAKDRRILQLEAELYQAQQRVRVQWLERNLGPVPIFGRR